MCGFYKVAQVLGVSFERDRLIRECQAYAEASSGDDVANPLYAAVVLARSHIRSIRVRNAMRATACLLAR